MSETQKNAPLSQDELQRYARHIVLPEIGGAGQQRLKLAKVLVIGAGGLGSPVLQYLAAAGIGTLGVVDDDIVTISNLQRQIIHDTDQVGVSKVESAAQAIGRINPHVTVIKHALRLGTDNALSLIRDFDLVIDGSDNFETRYLVADCCESECVTLITGAVGRFDGSLTTLKPFEKNEKGELHPRYRDIFPNRPPDGMVSSCAEAGIIGALTGIIGTMLAMEAIKELTGNGESLIGQLLLYDSMNASIETINYRRKPQS